MVDELTELLTTHIVLLLLVLTRLSTLLMTVPAIGTGVPKRVRALLAIALTLVIAPSVSSAMVENGGPPQAAHLIDLTMMLAREALIGLLIGSVVQILIMGMQLAGEIMTGTGGMQLGDAIDPTTQASMPTLAQMVGWMVIAILLSIGGHRMVVSSLVDSFQSLPPGQVTFSQPMLGLVTGQMSLALASGVRVSAPVVAALLLSNLITGLISRTLPQINVLAIGLSINALTLLAVCAMAIGSVGYVFQSEFEFALNRLSDLWAGVE